MHGWRVKTRMADGIEVTLYSVTLEKNIQGIIDAGGCLQNSEEVVAWQRF